MRFVRIPEGRFVMGSVPQEVGRAADEGPAHAVRITQSFYLGVFPVTQEQYQAVMDVNPACFGGTDRGNHPVESVSWDDAREFCQRLSARDAEKARRHTYRLPTEAEWEYACRAGTQTPFHGGAALSAAQANCDGEQPYGGAEPGPNLHRTTPVGSYPANAWGLADMHGNVWEWCQDAYDEHYYRASPPADPRGPARGSQRVVRGGAWMLAARYCRSARREKFPPAVRSSLIGFRVVLQVGPAQERP
jgi:formylglycine-generating enzyme required for sulfatase activity